MKRFDIDDDVLFDLHPGYDGEVMVPAENGAYVKYKDVIAMLDKISKEDPDMSPREAIIKYIWDEVNEVEEATLRG
jgi:hypothetical protein